ncbi:hypothetical protein EJP69_14185 [Variovorax gossypii]|uniref:Uncharacterized protein n=1 Tax=Variovorax gossypii TaxID=1679495 RepID=A0A431TP59_9BURK|nr:MULTISPECIES: hypothetical protein [Variovorax]MDR6522196.1 hypothetical protein [Variovorax paradoxus]RTQ35506.1 hypothetical protein EJP69_14185 [Variovorax gossypii]
MNELIEERRHLVFERRPAPVLVEHRPLYKICQLLLVLRLSSRGGKSTLPRLHLFNWALKRTGRMQKLVDAAKAKALHITAWGFDPAVAIAIRYAVAEDLIKTTSTGYQITGKGQALIDEVLEDEATFSQERALLKEIGKEITENMVESVAKGWESA